MNNERLFDQLRESVAEEATIREVLTRGVHEVIPEKWGDKGLEKQLKDRRLKLYLGIDPTSPNLHIGHTVPLRTLRRFQDLGHEVVLLFGTFTGMIGDPTDKSAARVKLTSEEINRNVATYKEQAGRILDLSSNAKNPITIAHNHEWLGKMSFADVVELMSNFTVQQTLERSMFADRLKSDKPIWLHELSYPLMQGWDSVALGVDLEIGGKDQTFNMLVGRDLVKRYMNKDKWVMATKLIEDPDGKKMGKTEGNIVNVLDWPEWMYEAIMTWPDSATGLGFELITDVPMEKVQILNELIAKGGVEIYQAKAALAYRAVSDLHGIKAAEYAEEEFLRVMRKKELPLRIREVSSESGSNLGQILVTSGLAKDLNDASSKIARGAIYVDGKMTKDKSMLLKKDMIVSEGKKTIKGHRRIV